MRTTITIDDEVLEQLRARAAKEATTISQLIEDAVRLTARPQSDAAPEQPFQLVTFGKGGRFTRFDVDRVSTLIEQDDLTRYGNRE